jgi:hypothetical protein
MATGIASGQADAILDAYARSVAYSDPAAFWVKLHTGDPGSAGTSNAYGDTTRQQPTFSAASGGSITTSAPTTWTSVSATATVSHLSFWSSSSGGTFLGSDDLASAQGLQPGNDFTIPTGQLTITLGTVAS